MFKKKKQKIYDFKYTIYWKDETTTTGEVKNSYIHPADTLLTGKMTCYGDGNCCYYNPDEIKQIEVTDFREKVEK